MIRWANRLVSLGRLPMTSWEHFWALFRRRRVLANWPQLWIQSNPVRVILARRLARGRSSGEVVIRFRNGLTLGIDESMRGSAVALSDTYRSYMHRLGTPLRGGDTVIDVGAHVGTFCVPALYENSAIRVLAYEPDPQNFALL